MRFLVIRGVTESSVLSNALFRLFVILSREAEVVLQYTTVYVAESTIDELASVVNKELQQVVKHVTNNKLVLNVSKTKSIVFRMN